MAKYFFKCNRTTNISESEVESESLVGEATN